MVNVTVFFDIGGTLLDNPSIGEVVVSRLDCPSSDDRARELYSQIFSELVQSIRNGAAPFMNVAEIHRQALLEMSVHGYKDISNEAKDIAVDTYGRRSKMFPEAMAVLEGLRKKGARMVVASDNDFDVLAVERSKHDLDRYFSDYWISEAARAYKPTPRFVSGLRRFLPPKKVDCFFVGDTALDVECAVKLGVTSVLVDRASTGATADHVVTDLSGLLHVLGNDAFDPSL